MQCVAAPEQGEWPQADVLCGINCRVVWVASASLLSGKVTNPVQ